MRRLTCPLILVSMVTAASAPAFAEWNPTPIAVPLLNAETAVSSPGAPYPSTITVAPPGGANHVAFISVMLHAVTHPCPDDLAVLLVRGTEKYLPGLPPDVPIQGTWSRESVVLECRQRSVGGGNRRRRYAAPATIANRPHLTP